MVHGPVREVVRGPGPLDWSMDWGSVFSGHPRKCQHKHEPDNNLKQKHFKRMNTELVFRRQRYEHIHKQNDKRKHK